MLSVDLLFNYYMENIRDSLKEANDLITESIKELEEIAPTEIETIETLKEKRIEIWWIIQEIDKATSN